MSKPIVIPTVCVTYTRDGRSATSDATPTSWSRLFRTKPTADGDVGVPAQMPHVKVLPARPKMPAAPPAVGGELAGCFGCRGLNGQSSPPTALCGLGAAG